MKRILLSALLGLLVAGAALAQTAGTNTVARNSHYFNATTGQKTNADGDAKVEDVTSEWSFLAFNHALFSRDTMAIGAHQDSSLFYPTGNARQMWLKLKAEIIGPGNAVAHARFAIEVRCAYENPGTADTMLVAPWMPSVTFGAAAPATDSLAYTMAGRTPTGFAGGASGSSEFVVTMSNFSAVAGATAELTSFSSSMWIPLADSRGVFLWAPYTQVRARVLGAPYNTVRLTANLVGRP